MALSTVAITQFRAQFINVYQMIERKLAGTVMEVRGVVGNSYKFPTAGKIILHDRGAYSSPIPASEVDYHFRTVVFSDKIALVPSDIFEQAETNASERQNLAKTAAYAISRWEDQFVINAAAGGTETIVDGATNLPIAKIIEASTKLNIQNVPKMGRHIMIHANQLGSLLSEEEVTSSDYNTVRALVRGEIETFLGFKFHVFGDMDEGGLPKTGDIRTCYAWQEDSMGIAYSISPTVTVDWDPRIQSFIVVPKVRAGATALLPSGIVKIDCDETA